MNTTQNSSERNFEIKLTPMSGKLMSYTLYQTHQGSSSSLKCQSNLPQGYFLYSCYIYFIAPGLDWEGAELSLYVTNDLQTSKTNNGCQS